MKIWNIYLISNACNAKVYVGQTIFSIDKRFKEHKSPSAKMFISKAIKELGADNFQIKLLCQCSSQEEANEKEIQLIKEYKATHPDYGYNVSVGGGNYYLSSEQCKRRSDEEWKELGRQHTQKLISYETDPVFIKQERHKEKENALSIINQTLTYNEHVKKEVYETLIKLGVRESVGKKLTEYLHINKIYMLVVNLKHLGCVTRVKLVAVLDMHWDKIQSIFNKWKFKLLKAAIIKVNKIPPKKLVDAYERHYDDLALEALRKLRLA